LRRKWNKENKGIKEDRGIKKRVKQEKKVGEKEGWQLDWLKMEGRPKVGRTSSHSEKERCRRKRRRKQPNNQ